MSDAPGLYGRPTAAEILEAVRLFLEDDVVEATDDRLRFEVRVAANLLAVVERELAAGEGPLEEHRRGLAALGAADDAELAALVRAGALDGRRDELLDHLARMARLKVAVTDPRHLAVRSDQG